MRARKLILIRLVPRLICKFSPREQVLRQLLLCGGKLKIIAAIEEPAVIERILTQIEPAPTERLVLLSCERADQTFLSNARAKLFRKILRLE